MGVASGRGLWLATPGSWPPSHAHSKEVFEETRNQCMIRAMHPAHVAGRCILRAMMVGIGSGLVALTSRSQQSQDGAACDHLARLVFYLLHSNHL